MTESYRPIVRASYFTRKQAAEYLGISTRTVDRWLRSGKLTAVPDGPRLLRVTIESVEAIVAQDAK
jgi:excisionase family DNA binding protein